MDGIENGYKMGKLDKVHDEEQGNKMADQSSGGSIQQGNEMAEGDKCSGGSEQQGNERAEGDGSSGGSEQGNEMAGDESSAGSEQQGNKMAGRDESSGTSEEPTAQYVKLISSDKHEFIIGKQYVLVSKKIREMLEVPGSPEDYNTVNLEMPSHIVEKLCLYFLHNRYFSSCPCRPNDEIKLNFLNVITPETAIDLLSAAIFLQC